MKTKNILKYNNFIIEKINNLSSDKFITGDVLFHGTSLEQYLKIKNNNYNVKDLYITSSIINAKEYAYLRSEKDENGEDDPVIIVLNYEYLDGVLNDDIHDFDYTNGEFDEKQDGQYIFNGNIKKSIYHAFNLVTKQEIETYKTIN